jgi:hypothetical protein
MRKIRSAWILGGCGMNESIPSGTLAGLESAAGVAIAGTLQNVLTRI